ncbi:A/G-specific adenine glycosylase [Ahrensia sp. R2A130]|uniref:A/G-specific adenine glycosylase n=1 Tax=Ahrensia sp. R2A130 TaxID=744979 RepID=UPI0012EA2B4A|nr:A/G-specific adenine glycosylase [Ahrensia sp. R2A130]
MDSFSTRLLDWYDRHARTLPWRIPPEQSKAGVRPDPYRVWLSEVMLQQTTVAAVKAYFETFTTIWPTVNDLAAAENDDVMSRWAGLGYYARARNLKACAEIVTRDYNGRFPETEDELRKLPGIGDYTAASIAAIAFGECAAVVDGNIERVLTRHRTISTPLPKAKGEVRAVMAEVTPTDRPGDFAQAMMDLGATICTSKNPVCGLCPVAQDCAARNLGTMLNYPVKKPKKQKPTRRGAAFVAWQGDEFFTIRRPEDGMLGGMQAPPSTDWSSKVDGATGIAAAPFVADWKQGESITHTFTHFHIELEVWSAQVDAPIQGKWMSEINDLPTLFRKVIRESKNYAADPIASR